MYYVSQVTCCRLAVWVVFGCLSGSASSCCGMPGIGVTQCPVVYTKARWPMLVPTGQTVQDCW